MGKGTIIRPEKVRPYVCGDDYVSRLLLDHTNTETKNFQINMGVVSPGAALLPASKHGELGERNNDEIYVILSGSCQFEMDGEVFTLKEDDIVFIPAGVYHGLDNREGTEPVKLLTIWGGLPNENHLYTQRVKEWGKSFMLVEE
jgi:mannose-6-phosphate isomerase-like protein (cupin superfamily)